MADHDIAVIGGGVVGMSVAFGLVRRGRRVIVFDEGDHAFRASRGNFGLVWVQGKGDGLHDYAEMLVSYRIPLYMFIFLVV